LGFSRYYCGNKVKVDNIGETRDARVGAEKRIQNLGGVRCGLILNKFKRNRWGEYGLAERIYYRMEWQFSYKLTFLGQQSDYENLKTFFPTQDLYCIGKKKWKAMSYWFCGWLSIIRRYSLCVGGEGAFLGINPREKRDMNVFNYLSFISRKYLP